jgi:hypothetical protein
MRTANDNRLWFDKADGKTLFGVFTDQRFYSSQFEETYEGEADDLRALVDLFEQYTKWCKDNYLERRAGNPQIPLPTDLRRMGVPPLLTEQDLDAIVDEAIEEVLGEAQAHTNPEEG